jgi:hypothetical protein
MSSFTDWLRSHLQDYGQLVEPGTPLNNQYQQLKSNVSQNVPPSQAFRDPSQLSEWSQAAALNAPSLGTIKKLNPNVRKAALEAIDKGATYKQLWRDFQAYPWMTKNGKRTVLGEIPDTLESDVYWRQQHPLEPGFVDPLPMHLKHDQLYAEQPEMANLYLTHEPNYEGGTAGFFQAPNLINLLGPDGGKTVGGKKTTLHEIGHAQQYNMNLPGGANSNQYTPKEVLRWQTQSTKGLQDMVDRIAKRFDIKDLAQKQYGDPGVIGKINDALYYNTKGIENQYLRNKLGNLSRSTRNPAFGKYYNDPGEAQARMIDARSDYSPRQLIKESPIETMLKDGYSLQDIFKPHRKP